MQILFCLHLTLPPAASTFTLLLHFVCVQQIANRLSGVALSRAEWSAQGGNDGVWGNEGVLILLEHQIGRALRGVMS